MQLELFKDFVLLQLSNLILRFNSCLTSIYASILEDKTFQLNKFSTSSQVLAAQVQKPAPAFKAQAVVGGQFKEVSLEDYKVIFCYLITDFLVQKESI